MHKVHQVCDSLDQGQELDLEKMKKFNDKMRDHFIKDHVLKKDDDVSKEINASQSKI